MGAGVGAGAGAAAVTVTVAGGVGLAGRAIAGLDNAAGDEDLKPGAAAGVADCGGPPPLPLGLHVVFGGSSSAGGAAVARFASHRGLLAVTGATDTGTGADDDDARAGNDDRAGKEPAVVGAGPRCMSGRGASGRAGGGAFGCEPATTGPSAGRVVGAGGGFTSSLCMHCWMCWATRDVSAGKVTGDGRGDAAGRSSSLITVVGRGLSGVGRCRRAGARAGANALCIALGDAGSSPAGCTIVAGRGSGDGLVARCGMTMDSLGASEAGASGGGGWDAPLVFLRGTSSSTLAIGTALEPPAMSGRGAGDGAP
eukprot:Opistho-2@23793